jgi:hypothetical protein
MGFRNRAVVAGTVVAAVVSIGVLTGVLRDGAGIDAQLDACVSPDGSTYNGDCLQLVWDNAVRDDRLRTFVPALERFVADHPGFEVPCHDEAHTAGIRAYELRGDIDALVLAGTSQRSVCDNGFLHGALGAMGRSGAGDGAVIEVIHACELLPEPGAADCVHASGHAVWPAVRNVTAAVGLCRNYSRTDRTYSCMFGVMMTVLSPQHDPLETPLFPGYREALAGYPSLCAEGTALLGADWMSSCLMPLGEMAVTEAVRTADMPLDSPTIRVEHVEDLLDSAIVPCATTSTSVVGPCRFAVYRAVFRQLAGNRNRTLPWRDAICATATARAHDPEKCETALRES